jgi:LuxR family maltose regulon positive regulatory protein
MSGDVAGAVEAGLRSVERGETPWRPVGCPVLGIALFWSGRPVDAAVELEHAVRLADSGANHLAMIHASAGLAAIRAEGGDLEAGEELAARALALADERSLDRHWATAMARVVRGRALEGRGQVEQAAEEIDRAAELARRGVAAVEIAYSLLWQAQLGGASGAAAELLAEAHAVAGRCPDSGILSEMLAEAERRLRPPSREASSVDQELTAREMDVLRLMAGDLSQRAIGEALYLSLNTIKTHTRLIYRKFGVGTRAEAVERGRELGLL